MARTKPARRKNSKTNNDSTALTSENQVADGVDVNDAYEASKNTRLCAEQIFENHDDETVDDSQDENVYDDTNELKLQDIQNIVIGDVKQIRVTESSFGIENNDANRCSSQQQTTTIGDEVGIKGVVSEENNEQVLRRNEVSAAPISESIAADSCTMNDASNDANAVESANNVEMNEDVSVGLLLPKCEPSSEISCSAPQIEYVVRSETSPKDESVEELTQDTDRIRLEETTTNCDKLSESAQDEMFDESDDESVDYQVVDEDFDLSMVDDKGKSVDYDELSAQNSTENNLVNECLLQCSNESNAIAKTNVADRIPSPDQIDERCHPLNNAKQVIKEKSKDTFEDILMKIDVDTRQVAQRIPKIENRTANNRSKKSSPKDVTNEESASTTIMHGDESIKSSNHKPEKKDRSEKKETRGRPRKNKENSKQPTVQSTDKDDEEDSKKERRRRSSRLKLRPDPKEEEKMIAKLLRDTERENNDSKEGQGESKQAPNRSSEITVSVAVEESAEMPPFQPIVENEYLTERSFSKDAERMICDCTLTKEEIIRGEKGCGEDCLNRLLLIECCSRCALGDRCANKRFQKRHYVKCEAYKTQKKGFGLRVTEDIPSGAFIMEYVGEVIDSDEFEERAMKYAREKIPHFYFMALKSDYIIDATMKGNVSRFINHSCEPNAETQKWTVQGELRIGFFSKRDISAGEEITFDYQLQRYGKQAQRCYCEAPSCAGWIGEDPDKQVEDDKRKDRRKKKHNEQYQDWEATLDEICQVGLINRHQTLSLNRLMVHAKELPVRMQILQLIEEGHPSCRRLFVDYHGLPIIWSWMVDCTPQQEELKIQLLKTLEALPITNKTILVDSKVYSLVEQWAFVVDQKLQSEALSAQSVLESVEEIATADETPVSELAQKVLNAWSSLREAYKIPRKERIQQMKEHEREADQNAVKARPRKLPLYAERMRDIYHRNRYNKDKDFDKIYYDRLKDKRRKDSPDRGRDGREHRKDGGNKVSRMEHRYMFEMKVARENEERRRKWEGEEQNFWLQQSQNFFYGGQQQAQMVAGQYMPPSFTPDLNAISPALLQNIQSLTSSAQSHTQNYYGAAAAAAAAAFMLPAGHLSTSTPTGAAAAATAASMLTNAASSQSFYSNNVPLSSYVNDGTVPMPVPYPQSRADCADETISSYASSYDYQNASNQPTMTPKSGVRNEFDEANLVATDATDAAVASALGGETSAVPQRCRLSKEEAKKLLPPKWKIAFDSGNNMYFYHKETRQSQWYLPTESAEPAEAEGSTEDDSSQDEDDEDDEESAAGGGGGNRRKRKIEQNDDSSAHYGKRSLKTESDMDAEIKENLAAMSSEFQDTDNEDYSPVVKNNDDGSKRNSSDETSANKSPCNNNPLVTEHIISPREPIDKEERMRNKQRIRSRKEKLKRQKKHKKISMLDECSDAAMNGLHANNSISSSSGGGGGGGSNNSNLLSVPADTSSITDRRKKEAFRSTMANFVVNCLNPYFRSSCTSARITNYNDFKHLARKLTHFVMVKELKHCRSSTDLSCNASVKHKAKEFIKKYMSKFGEVYIRPPDDNKDYNSF